MRNLSFLTAFALTLFTAPAAFATDCTAHGEWLGTIKVPGSELKIEVELTDKSNQWSGKIAIPQQKLKDFSLSDVTVNDKSVHFKMKGVPGTPTFKGIMDDSCSILSGDFLQGESTLSFKLGRPSSKAAQEAAEKQKVQLEALATWIDTQREALQVAGAAVLIVKDDKVIFQKGFGKRDKKAAVDPKTLFAIGSSTKAFTSALVGKMVDQGKLNWNTPVQDILPDFRLKDGYATQYMTVQDLLTHQSGLPRHDLSWYGSSATRQSIYNNLKYLEPSAQLRQESQYQNLMYMTAGILSEKLMGKSWETLIKQELFEPLAMTQSQTLFKDVKVQGNYALPYQVKKGKLSPMAFRSAEAIGPAGSIFSNLEDMSHWLRFQLGNGTFDKTSIIEPHTLKYIHTPHRILAKDTHNPKMPFILYGLGWMVHPYGPELVVQHGGNIDGFSALVGMVPQQNLGIVILTNQDKSALPHFVMLHSFETLLGHKSSEFETRIKAISKKLKSPKPSSEDRFESLKVRGTRPLHAINTYSATYTHPAYGTVNVSEKWGKLTLKFRDLGGELKHLHYDTFLLKKSTILSGLKVQFETNILGELAAVSLPLEGSVAPIRFEKQAAPRFFASTYLNQFTGTYLLQGLRMSVKSSRKGLRLSVPSQPTYLLLPTAKNRFKVKDYPGYFVRFEKAKSGFKAILIQPQGVIEALPSK